MSLSPLVLLLAIGFSWQANLVFAVWHPVRIGVVEEIVDEFDETLEGTSPGASDFGLADVEGDLVHVLRISAGHFPPQATGEPNPANTIAYATRVGVGTSPTAARPGKFGGSLVPRENGQSYIVRIYNAPSLAEASFYVDSAPFSVSASDDPTIIIQAQKTSSPIDPNDDDGDGLNNSWEKSYGSDSSKSDSDGDGVADGDEHAAGTDPTDENDRFVVAQISMNSGEMKLRWASVPGKTYQVECKGVASGSDFEALGNVLIANHSLTDITLSNASLLNQAIYRVRVITE